MRILRSSKHSSIAPQNKCSYAKLNTFFQEGKLPGKDNYCKLEAGPWNITVEGPLERRADLERVKRGLVGLKQV